MESNVWLSCRNNTQEDLNDTLKELVAHKLTGENGLHLDIVDQMKIGDELKVKIQSHLRKRETLLNEKLSDIVTNSQAYHGNVLVGNHCRVVLKHNDFYAKLWKMSL